jgi:hypothetical protein
MYLIDTNVISEARKRAKANRGVREFFRRVTLDSPHPIPKELQNLSQLAWISMPLEFLVFDLTKHPIAIALIPSHSRHGTSLKVCTT